MLKKKNPKKINDSLSEINTEETLVKSKTNEPSTKADRKSVEDYIERASSGSGPEALVDLFDQLMVYAHLTRSSDIHLEPWKGHGVARLRIDGILHHEFQLESLVFTQLIARLK